MIKDVFSKQLENSVTPASTKVMMKAVIDYVDYNSEMLLTMDMSNRYSFGDKDRQVIYDYIGVTEDEIVNAVNNSKIYKGNKNHNNPFYISCMLAMYQLMKDNKSKEAMIVMTYMSLLMYTSIHKGFFKYGVNRQIMDYVIAHLDNSFALRNMPSIYAFIQDNAATTFNTYTSRIKKCNDEDITYVIDALHTRLKGKMRKVSNLYYDAHKNGNYLNADEDSYSDTEFHEIDNNSFAIDRLANKIYIRMINHQFDDRLIKYAITRSDVSYQKLKNLIDDIISDDTDNQAKDYLVAMIEYYLRMSGRTFDSIARGEYITYMKSAYASNTEMKQMVFIKNTLDKWLNDHMMVVGRLNYGKTAKLSYKKAVYMFFVFLINHEAKL